jgi:hypothetical protein
MNDVSEDYRQARGAALALPTWVLRRWELRATRRAAQGTPARGELARLLAVRAVLRDRGDR